MNNLQNIRKVRGFSQKKVASEVGVTQSQYSRYESGITNIPCDMLAKLAEYFGVTVDELLNEKAEAPVKLPPNTLDHSPVAPASDRIPLVGSIRCGNLGSIDASLWETTYAPPELTARWGRENLFAHIASGSSMAPNITAGDTLIFAKNAPWQNGDIVAALVDDGETVKRIYRCPGDRIELRPDNPAFKTMSYTPAEAEAYQIQVIAKLVYILRSVP